MLKPYAIFILIAGYLPMEKSTYYSDGVQACGSPSAGKKTWYRKCSGTRTNQ